MHLLLDKSSRVKLKGTVSQELNIHFFAVSLKCSRIANANLLKVIFISFQGNKCIWLKLFQVSFHLKANCRFLGVEFIMVAIRLTVEVQWNATITGNGTICFLCMYSQAEQAI